MNYLLDQVTKETDALIRDLKMENFYRNENVFKIGANLEVLADYISHANEIFKIKNNSQHNEIPAVEPSENIQKEIFELEALIENIRTTEEMEESIMEEDFIPVQLERLAKKKLLLEEQKYFLSMDIEESDSLISSLQTILKF